VGVGVEVGIADHRPTIAQVLTNSPAAQGGLKAGDHIQRVDRAAVFDLSADAVAQRLKGAAGTAVELEVLTPGESNTRAVTLIRQPVSVPSVNLTQILNAEAGIGYCQVSAFHKGTPEELDLALLQLKLQGMKALVLDLRGNAGGLFHSALQVAERFLTDGIIVTTQSQVRDQNRTYRATNPGALSIPLVVLVDGDTASAAEIVAGALKEHQRATLVGQTTYGKGSIQRVLQLDTVPSGIRVTLARFFSPRGQPYGGNGVTPHIVIARAPMSMNDHPLEVATQEAARLAAVGQ
jgi:carboxyl-terminal processing protease